MDVSFSVPSWKMYRSRLRVTAFAACSYSYTNSPIGAFHHPHCMSILYGNTLVLMKKGVILKFVSLARHNRMIFQRKWVQHLCLYEHASVLCPVQYECVSVSDTNPYLIHVIETVVHSSWYNVKSLAKIVNSLEAQPKEFWMVCWAERLLGILPGNVLLWLV